MHIPSNGWGWHVERFGNLLNIQVFNLVEEKDTPVGLVKLGDGLGDVLRVLPTILAQNAAPFYIPTEALIDIFWTVTISGTGRNRRFFLRCRLLFIRHDPSGRSGMLAERVRLLRFRHGSTGTRGSTIMILPFQNDKHAPWFFIHLAARLLPPFNSFHERCLSTARRVHNSGCVSIHPCESTLSERPGTAYVRT